jgi:beta-glucanase (GH16 family)
MRHVVALFLIQAAVFGQLYRGAELRTVDPVLYGKFEARYKPAQGDGLVSSFLHIMMIIQIHLGRKLILRY